MNITEMLGLQNERMESTFNYVAGWALNAVTEDRDLADILRSTGQRVIGAADLILQATQPTPTIIDGALDAMEAEVRTQVDPTSWEVAPAVVEPPPQVSPSSRAVAAPSMAI